MVLEDMEIEINNIRYRKTNKIPKELDLIKITKEFTNNLTDVSSFFTENGLYEVIEVYNRGNMFLILDDYNNTFGVCKNEITEFGLEVYEPLNQ